MDSDVAAVAAIYAHHVLHGTASFETEAPDAAEIGARRQNVMAAGLPWIVAESEGTVAGYAYAARYRPRPAYRYTVEDSVYVHPERLGQGVGRLLLARLIELCESAGARQMVAIIGDTANAASIRLHERCGFRHAGVLEAVGFKFGRWLDTVLMQRATGRGATGSPVL